MVPRLQPAIIGSVLVAACVLAACGGSPSPRSAARATTTSSSTTTTTTTPTTTTTVVPGVVVPNVLSMKPDLARFYLRTAGFSTVPMRAACDKGTAASESVVESLSVPGKPPDVRIGAVPLLPGTTLPKGARVGITWSDCYPNGTAVPLVTGHTFSSAVQLLHLAGLAWACYSVGTTSTTTHPKTTTTRSVTTSTAIAGSTTSSTSAGTTSTSTTTTTTTIPNQPQTVLSQGAKAGTVIRARTVVALVMHRCPQ